MAGKTRTILVAVDEGSESAYALSWCLNNIVCDPNSEDTVILVHAKPPRMIYDTMDSSGYMCSSDVITSMEGYGNEVAKRVIETSKKICKNLKDHVKVETVVEHGDPRDVICDAADKLKVDLLIIGSHGYGAIKRAFLGSVSSHCAQNVKCPVLIVKKPKDPKPIPDGADH